MERSTFYGEDCAENGTSASGGTLLPHCWINTKKVGNRETE